MESVLHEAFEINLGNFDYLKQLLAVASQHCVRCRLY